MDSKMGVDVCSSWTRVEQKVQTYGISTYPTFSQPCTMFLLPKHISPILCCAHSSYSPFYIKALNATTIPVWKSSFRCKDSNSTKVVGREVLPTSPKLLWKCRSWTCRLCQVLNVIYQTLLLHLLKHLHNFQSSLEICLAFSMNDCLPFETMTQHLHKSKSPSPKLKCNLAIVQ